MTQQQKSVHRMAREAADSAYRTAFFERAKEIGGVTDKTRSQLDAEATLVAEVVRLGIYELHGYRACGCGSMVNPRFATCFVCGARNTAFVFRARPPEPCRRCMGTGRFITQIVNGQPVGPGGPCYRCAGKGEITEADRRRNWGHDNFAPIYA